MNDTSVVHKLFLVCIIVIVIFAFSGTLRDGWAEARTLGDGAYPAPVTEIPLSDQPYPAPGTETSPIEQLFPSSETELQPVEPPEWLTQLMTERDSLLSEVDGQTVVVHNLGGARQQDAEEYTKYFRVSQEEALYRLDLQESVGQLKALLIEQEIITFAGIWIQHQPDFGIVVQFTENGEDTLKSYISDTALATVKDIIDVRTALHSYEELKEQQTSLDKLLDSLEIDYALQLNERENRIVIMVLDSGELNIALEKASFMLPDYVDVKQVESFGTKEVNIYGGMDDDVKCPTYWTSSTTGYNLTDTFGSIFASTAGHMCFPDTSEYIEVNGIIYPTVDKVLIPNYDFEWNLIPQGSNPQPWVRDGYDDPYPSYRVINTVTDWNYQSVGEWVCKWGRTTNLTCGIIEDTQYLDQGSYWVRVDGGTVDLSEGGDSGSPWFSYDRSYGMHVGRPGDDVYDSVYMPVDRVRDFGFEVQKSENAISNYFPDLRNNLEGWTSTLYIRNDASSSRNITLRFYNQNGTERTGATETRSIGAKSQIVISVNGLVNGTYRIATNGRGSATVTGGRDISTYVVQKHAGSPESWANYPGITNPNTEVHIPLVYRHSSWGYYSQIFVRNSGLTATNIKIEFFDPEQGQPYYLPTIYNIQPNQLVVAPLLDYDSLLGDAFYGSVRITNSANQLLAVTSTNYKLDHSTMAESSHTSGLTNIVYAPIFQNYNYDYISGQTLQNAGWSTAQIKSRYYNQNGTECNGAYALSPDIDPYRSWLLYPPGNPMCSSVISAIVSRLDVTTGYLTGVTNQMLQGASNYSVYEEIANPSNEVSVPLWYNAKDGWTSGITIQNIHDEPVSIAIYYYNANGQLYTNPVYYNNIAPHEIMLLTNTTGALRGSVEIFASRPVAVVSNIVRSASDGLMTSSGVHK